MTDRGNAGGGGMTGATGDLTPDDSSEGFTPGERREIEGTSRADVTRGSGRAAARDMQPGTETPSDATTDVGGDELDEKPERF